ncbi:MAG: DMT family transporter [Bosea sp. (in: a-proteobacteria)]
MLDALIVRFMPVLFVLIWSTGWLSAGYSAPYADALTFLSLRFACAALLLGLLSVMLGAEWPKDWRGWLHALVAGILLHGIYLGGVWWAVRHGLPAGISALIAALQPIMTAALSLWLVRERVSPVRWAGIAVGFVGIALVLAPKLIGIAPGTLMLVLVPILINIGGMVAVTAGSFYQKRFQQSGDLRTMTTVQYLGAIMVTLPLAYALEPMVIVWNMTMVLVLAWSVIGLSLGGIGLYLLLIRRGEVSRAATLIYLVPPAAAVETYFLLGERLSSIQIVGMAVTVIGVILASRK